MPMPRILWRRAAYIARKNHLGSEARACRLACGHSAVLCMLHRRGAEDGTGGTNLARVSGGLSHAILRHQHNAKAAADAEDAGRRRGAEDAGDAGDDGRGPQQTSGPRLDLGRREGGHARADTTTRCGVAQGRDATRRRRDNRGCAAGDPVRCTAHDPSPATYSWTDGHAIGKPACGRTRAVSLDEATRRRTSLGWRVVLARTIVHPTASKIAKAQRWR